MPLPNSTLVGLILIPYIMMAALPIVHMVSTKMCGKAKQVDMFTGEAPELRSEDWLLSLQQAAHRNTWNADEQLLQLAGHLFGTFTIVYGTNKLGNETRNAFL